MNLNSEENPTINVSGIIVIDVNKLLDPVAFGNDLGRWTYSERKAIKFAFKFSYDELRNYFFRRRFTTCSIKNNDNMDIVERFSSYLTPIDKSIIVTKMHNWIRLQSDPKINVPAVIARLRFWAENHKDLPISSAILKTAIKGQSILTLERAMHRFNSNNESASNEILINESIITVLSSIINATTYSSPEELIEAVIFISVYDFHSCYFL